MRDLPILFSAPMVRALLAGKKTQTRRLVNVEAERPIVDFVKVATDKDTGRAIYEMKDKYGHVVTLPAGKHFRTPHFSPPIAAGDRLYVREHWRTLQKWDDLSPRHLADDRSKITYEADPERRNPLWAFGRHRQAMHMPKWASRITLLVDDVKVERLQDISEDDAIAEGIEKQPYTGSDPQFHGMFAWKDYSDHPHAVVGFHHEKPVLSYRSLWDSINGEGAWDENPWVVAYTFRVLLGNIDCIGKVEP